MDLATYLQLKKIRHKDFAEIIGVSKATLSNYLAAKRKPPLDIAHKIQDITKGSVKVKDLLEFWENNFKSLLEGIQSIKE